MNHVDTEHGDLVTRLRRLDAVSTGAGPDFDYERMIERHAVRKARARRRAVAARGVAGALVMAMIGVSAWHLGRTPGDAPGPDATASHRAQRSGEAIERNTAPLPEQRLVRADTWLALAAIEEHIANIDDALTDARLDATQGVDVARLERTRAELLDSHAHVRYADMVAVNF